MKLPLQLFSFFLFLLIVPSAMGQSSIPIRELAPFPDSVLSTSSAMLPDNRVIVWGGQKQVQTPSGKIWLSNKSYIYDYQSDSWTAGPELNNEVYGSLTITMANGNILSIGGQGYTTIANIDSIPMRTDVVEMLDVVELIWTVIDSVPFGNSPYTGTSGVLLPDSNVWLTSTNGDYGTLDISTMTWTDHNGLFGPLDAGGRPIVVLDNGIIFHTGAGGQYYDMTNQMITYADPVIPLHSGNVVKLKDGRILTWEDEFSFSQEAIIVAANASGSSLTDSLVIPGQSTNGILMPDSNVWIFGLGEPNFPPLTLLQIFDVQTETFSSPGTYNFRPDLPFGYKLFLLPDSSVLLISSRTSYRINDGSATSVKQLQFLDWKMAFVKGQRHLTVIPGSAGSQQQLTFSLMDINGREVIRRELRGKSRVELEKFANGLYVARLQGKNGAQLVRKIRLE